MLDALGRGLRQKKKNQVRMLDALGRGLRQQLKASYTSSLRPHTLVA
jgi:hypothetical protein